MLVSHRCTFEMQEMFLCMGCQLRLLGACVSVGSDSIVQCQNEV